MSDQNVSQALRSPGHRLVQSPVMHGFFVGWAMLLACAKIAVHCNCRLGLLQRPCPKCMKSYGRCSLHRLTSQSHSPSGHHHANISLNSTLQHHHLHLIIYALAIETWNWPHEWVSRLYLLNDISYPDFHEDYVRWKRQSAEIPSFHQIRYLQQVR